MPVTPVDVVRVLAAALALLLPGFALRPLLLPARNGFSTAAVVASGLVGLGGLALVLWLGALVDASLNAALVAWALAGAGALLARRFDRGTSPKSPDDDAFALFDAPAARWLPRLLILSALLALPFGTYTSGGADTWEYFNRAAQILRTGQLQAGSPYGPELHSPYDPTFYALIAAVAQLSAVDVARVGALLTVIATPLELFAVVLGATWVLNSLRAGLVSGLVYLLLYGPFFLFRNSLHHQMLADALFLVALGLVVRHLDMPRRRHLVAAAFAAAASATLHHFLLVQCAFVIGLTGLVGLSCARRAGRPIRPAIEATLAVALGLVPMVLVLLGTHLEDVDPRAMDDFFRNVYAPLLHFGALYIPDPFVWYMQRFWHPLPAVLLLIWLWPRLRDDRRALLLAVLVTAPLFIGMNPLLFPVAAELAGLQVATRLLNLTHYPSVFLIGWALAEAFGARRTGAPVRGPLLLAAASILLILPQTILRVQGDYAPASMERERRESPVSWRGALERLAAESTPGQTVLADPITAYSIPTFAPLSIVAHQRADFAFQAEDHAARTRAMALLQDPLASPDSLMAAIDRFHADWLLLNRRFANPLAIDRLDLLAGATRGFARVFDEEGIVAWRRMRGAEMAPPPSAELLRQELLIHPSIFAAFLEPGTGVVFDRREGLGAVIGPDQAGRGDTLYVTLYYEWRPENPAPPRYLKLMREEAYGSLAKLLARQWRSAVLGQSDVLLFPRSPYVDRFREASVGRGYVFADQFQLLVPHEAVPGRYALRMSTGGFPTEQNPGLKLGSVDIVKRRIDAESAAGPEKLPPASGERADGPLRPAPGATGVTSPAPPPEDRAARGE
jgi:hypothetical protein